MAEFGKIPTDTDPAVERVYLEKIRAMQPAERFLRACELTQLAREMVRSGIRERHPGADEAGVRRRFAAITLGDELATRYFKWDREGDGY